MVDVRQQEAHAGIGAGLFGHIAICLRQIYTFLDTD